MSQYVDLTKYQEFVEALTSKESGDLGVMIKRLQELDDVPNLNVSLLITAAIGLASETGEFDEVVKKNVFQGKPFSEETRFHLKRELGDIIWYWTNACRSLGLDPNEVIAENVNKLKSRYPGENFDVYHSENRKEGDL